MIAQIKVDKETPILDTAVLLLEYQATMEIKSGIFPKSHNFWRNQYYHFIAKSFSFCPHGLANYLAVSIAKFLVFVLPIRAK